MRMRSQSCSEGSDRDYPRSSSLKAARSSLRDIGVTCSVITREVGVSPQRPRLRNARTNTRTFFRRLGLSGVKTEEIPPDDSQSLQTANRPLSHLHKKLVKVSPMNAINFESVLKTATTKTSSTNTDLLKDHVYSVVEMDHNINRAIQMYEKTFSTRLHPKNTRDIGVQIRKAPEITPVLLIIERCDVAVQSEGGHCSREAFSQTEDLPRRLTEIGVSAKPRYVESVVQVTPRTRDVGASDDNINDVLCYKCKAKKRSIAVGHCSVTTLVAEEDTSISLSNIGILQNKPRDHSPPRTKKEATIRSIGCGTRNNATVSKGTDTQDLRAGRSRDFGVNTTKRKLVDAAIGDDMRRRNSGCGVFLCDKCDVTIQNVAKNMLTQNSDSTNPSPSVAVVVTSPSTNTLKTSPSATISRIPRLAPARGANSTSTTATVRSPIMAKEKHRIQRQDTYTKLQVDAENRLTTATPIQEKSRYTSHHFIVPCILMYFYGICPIAEYLSILFNPVAYIDA